MPPLSENGEKTYSIGGASEKSGVPVETVRIWERRYQVIQPTRTPGGHRVYSEHDVQVLSALKTLVDGGERIGRLSKMGPEAILASAGQTPVDSRVPEFDDILQDLLEAAATFDNTRAAELLDRPGLHRHALEVVLGLYLPLLVEVGDRWHAGTLSVASEHFIERLVTSRMMSILANQAEPSGPLVVCACTPGERHEAGLLASAILLQHVGLQVLYLGADLPADELGQVIETRRPRFVALAATLAPTDATVDALRAALSQSLPARAHVYLGGDAGPALANALNLDNVSYVDLPGLLKTARQLARSS